MNKIEEQIKENIDKELDEWEKERLNQWDDKQGCSTFLFELKQLNIHENHSAFELFIKCIKGYFTVLWISINFLFQPILCIFWTTILIPVKILVFIGMNLPGNRYNLTFSYKGKK